MKAKSVRRRAKVPRKRKPCCGQCHSPGFTKSTAEDGRPLFTCQRCGNSWTYGKDGGEYTAAAQPGGST